MKGLLFRHGRMLDLVRNAAAADFKQQVYQEFGAPSVRDLYETRWEAFSQYYLISGDILWVPETGGAELWLLLSAPSEGEIVEVNPKRPWAWTIDMTGPVRSSTSASG